MSSPTTISSGTASITVPSGIFTSSDVKDSPAIEQFMQKEGKGKEKPDEPSLQGLTVSASARYGRGPQPSTKQSGLTEFPNLDC